MSIRTSNKAGNDSFDKSVAKPCALLMGVLISYYVKCDSFVPDYARVSATTRRMSSPKRARILLWNREDISHCSCGHSKSVHAHCPCDVCRGKAVARSTEYHHWVATRE